MAIQTNSELYNFHILHRQENQLHFNDFISNVAGGCHSVSIFVLEGNGLPFNRSATIPQKLTVNGGKAAESGDEHTCRNLLACTYTFVLQLQAMRIQRLQLNINLSSHRRVFASIVASWIPEHLYVLLWYIDESLSWALVD